MSTGHGTGATAASSSMNMHAANETSQEQKINLDVPRNVTDELDYQTALGLISRTNYVLNNVWNPCLHRI